MEARLRTSRTSRVSVPIAMTLAFALTFVLTGCMSGPLEPGSGPTDGMVTPAAPVGDDLAPDTGPPATDVGPGSSPTESPTAEPDAAGPGCPANNGAIPDGADTAIIPDVDGDGLPDTHFYSEYPEFAYGIQTASGATVVLLDPLAGPNTHSGWSGRLESELVITVLDDGRSALVHAFVDCQFIATTDRDGNPYRLGLNGFSDDNTAVRCSNGNGGRQLIGVNAVRLPDTTYDIVSTTISISRDGERVVHTSPHTVATGVSASDEQVTSARDSRCADIPKVGTTGR